MIIYLKNLFQLKCHRFFLFRESPQKRFILDKNKH